MNEEVSKLSFDHASDFKFTAAYDLYSKLFDESPSPDNRNVLNDIISKLFNAEISYPAYYREVNHLRKDLDSSQRFTRTRIQGQRKRAYRRDQQERERIRRHKR